MTLVGAQKIAEAARGISVAKNYRQSIGMLHDGGNLVVFYRSPTQDGQAATEAAATLE